MHMLIACFFPVHSAVYTPWLASITCQRINGDKETCVAKDLTGEEKDIITCLKCLFGFVCPISNVCFSPNSFSFSSTNNHFSDKRYRRDVSDMPLIIIIKFCVASQYGIEK